jgi:hypothetical protein
VTPAPEEGPFPTPFSVHPSSLTCCGHVSDVDGADRRFFYFNLLLSSVSPVTFAFLISGTRYGYVLSKMITSVDSYSKTVSCDYFQHSIFASATSKVQCNLDILFFLGHTRAWERQILSF